MTSSFAGVLWRQNGSVPVFIGRKATMEFFADMKLKGANGVRRTETVVSGPLILEAREQGELILSRSLDVRYTAIRKGWRWKQRFEIRAGNEDVFTHEGITGINYFGNLDDRMRIKFAFFVQLISDCIEKHNGNARLELEFEDAPPELIGILLEMCGGRAN